MKKELTTEDVLSLTPRLPGNFIEMLRSYFAWQHYLFVWRNDNGDKTAYCTACRKEFVIDIDYSNYRESYKRGKTVICLIRNKKKPEQPFYTLEINPELTHVIQCRGKGNRGTTPEVEAFKNKWFARLQAKPGKEKLCQKTA